MLIIWGKQLYGAVDQVPGAFGIRTKFAHVYYLPLVPLESWVVLHGGTSKEWRGYALPGIHWRSVLMTWARLGLGVFAFFSAMEFLTGSGTTSPVLSAAFPVAAIVAWIASYRLSRASYERAIEIVRQHRMPPDLQAAVEASFGRAISPAGF